MSYVVQSKEYSNALANCSPKIQTFLRSLASRDGAINGNALLRHGYGTSPFTVVASLRSMSDQIDEFKKGRKVTVSKEYHLVGYDYPYVGTRYELSNAVVTDKSKVVTQVFGGRSYHNYGLAVDIYPTETKWKTTVDWNDVNVKEKIDVKEWFRRSGIVDLAKKCGLEWGGYWSDLYDPWHFQDNSFSLPRDTWEFNYDKNMNFDFIRDWNAGKFGGKVSASVKKSGFGAFAVLALSVGGLWYLLRGKK